MKHVKKYVLIRNQQAVKETENRREKERKNIQKNKKNVRIK